MLILPYHFLSVFKVSTMYLVDGNSRKECSKDLSESCACTETHSFLSNYVLTHWKGRTSRGPGLVEWVSGKS